MTANSTPESFDAVLVGVAAECTSVANACERDGGSPLLITYARKWAKTLDRLQSAHARELAEQRVNSPPQTEIAAGAMSDHECRAHQCRRQATEMQATIEALRETNRRLNRRCQDAESGLSDYKRITALPPDGDGIRFVQGSFGRALMVGLCNKQQSEIEALRSRADAAMGLLREVTEWIDGWSPNFADDSEWQPVADRIEAALAEQALAGGERKDG